MQAAFPPTMRAPDLVVVRVDGPENRVPASEALLAVEIISPGTRKVDTHLKALEYADAGIPHYWLIDLDPPAPTITVSGFGAPGDGYVESQTATGQLVVTEPFDMRIDIDALVARRVIIRRARARRGPTPGCWVEGALDDPETVDGHDVGLGQRAERRRVLAEAGPETRGRRTSAARRS